jgi:hypothetical protein
MGILMPAKKGLANFNFSTPAIYRIHVKGVLSSEWTQKLAGMQITTSSKNETLLVGKLADQAALAGVLEILYNLHLPVLSVECMETLSE